MIKANELRIGNLLLNAGGVVVSTTTQTISDVELKLIVRNPIPLTEEWLLKLGFEKYNDNYSIDTLHGLNSGKPSKLVIRYTELQNMVVVRPGNRTIYIKSVHQLQNLYFALTGEELELK